MIILTDNTDENNNCIPKKYDWLSTENFGDQRKVTEELLRSLMENENYLYSRVLELSDKTDPENRKRFNPIILNESCSFGVVQGTLINNDKVLPVYMFNNNEDGGYRKGVSFDYQLDDNIYDDELIDDDKTTCYIDPSAKSADGSRGEARIPKGTKSIVYKDTACIRRWNNGTKKWMVNWANNAYWYIGYNHNRNYNLKAEWLTHDGLRSIPSVCRAQTFKVETGGLLESVTLKLRVRTNTGSPLIVEIRTVDKRGYPSRKVLTREKIRFNAKGESCQALKFKHPITVTKGTKYAVVLRSPLSSYDNCYWIGGWGSNCNQDPYSKGSAFLSEDNGYTWIKHGKSEKVAYRDGQHAPVDFLFECHIKKTYTNYKTGKDFWLYLRPVYSNPVSEVTITPSIINLNKTEHELEFQVSRDGKHWDTLSESNAYTKTYDSKILKPCLLVRVRLKTTNSASSPELGALIINTKTVPQYKAYARTEWYYPEQSGMLASHIWSELNAPYQTENSNVSCYVDVVRNKTQKEYFKILNPTIQHLYTDNDYISLYKEDYPDILDDDTYTTLTTVETSTDDKFIEWFEQNYIDYHESNTSFNDYLQEQHVYLKGNFTKTSDENLKGTPYFSKIQLPDSPAYPLINVRSTPNSTYDIITPEEAIHYLEKTDDEEKQAIQEYTHENIVTYFKTGEGKTTADNLIEENIYIEEVNNETGLTADSSQQINYTEWIDYDVDYTENTIRFYTHKDDGDSTTTDDMEVKGNLPIGELTVEYNPLWVKGLTSQEMPLKMDLWTEKFTVTDNQKTYTTAVAPRDNIREILVNPYTNDEEELIEDIDYTVDYITNTITFTKQYPTSTIIQIKYTPNLTDLSLGLAYRLDRLDTVSQGYIKGNYWTTRT